MDEVRQNGLALSTYFQYKIRLVMRNNILDFQILFEKLFDI